MTDSIEVEVGEPFVVDAEAASGTGYAWTVERTSPGVESAGDPVAGEPARMPGAPTTTGFPFVAREPGRHEIELALRRPWEDEPAERRRVEVVARAGRVTVDGS